MLHSGRLWPYSPTFDQTGKACQVLRGYQDEELGPVEVAIAEVGDDAAVLELGVFSLGESVHGREALAGGTSAQKVNLASPRNAALPENIKNSLSLLTT
jgi:hypothetical protein